MIHDAYVAKALARAVRKAGRALLEDAIDGDEAERMRERLQAIIDVAQDTKARLPQPRTHKRR